MDLRTLLELSSARHSHLCPRQVLGVRIGLAGAAALGLEAPRRDKRLLVIVETDGCFVSGIEVATGAAVHHRTLRIEDYGKVAATFVDVETGQAVRVTPRLDVREKARLYAPAEKRRYFAQLKAYQIMPDEELLALYEVTLNTPVGTLVSRPGVRVNCTLCGEEIINEREVWQDGQCLCRTCAGASYYRPTLRLPQETVAAGVPMAVPFSPCTP
ncbi:MAG: FmdE family protein [Caldilineales bacterium]|nr:FmdE family protein [Caldilineales bacterium]